MKPVSGLPDSKIADQSRHNQHKLQLEVLFCGLIILLKALGRVYNWNHNFSLTD